MLWRKFEVQIYLNGLGPDAVQLELYANCKDNNKLVRQEMRLMDHLQGTMVFLIYSAALIADRPASEYTVRAYLVKMSFQFLLKLLKYRGSVDHKLNPD